MARLLNGSIAEKPWHETGDYNKWIERYRAVVSRENELVQEAIKEVRSKHPGDPLVGKIMRYPAADGYAQYLVCSTKPLTLKHIHEGDGYHASIMEIRGTRLADVLRWAVEWEPWPSAK